VKQPQYPEGTNLDDRFEVPDEQRTESVPRYAAQAPCRATVDRRGEVGQRCSLLGAQGARTLQQAAGSGLGPRSWVFLAAERTDRRLETRQHIEIALPNLKRIFRLGETLATTLAKLTARIQAKVMACTYAFLVNRLLGRPQGRIKDLWA
jgi:hypothetical protein